MKIVAKQVLTSIINDDGTYTNVTTKTVTVTDYGFDGISIETMHDEIFLALREKICKQGIDK